MSNEAEFPVLRTNGELFSNFILALELYVFFSLNAFFPKKTKIPEGLIFSEFKN